MKKTLILNSFGFFLCISCIIEDANVIVPAYKKEVVVNAFLTPDSLINVNLTYSINLDEPNKFVTIDDARVVIYENEFLLDTLMFVGNGNYVSEYFPLALQLYKIEIITTNGIILNAISLMPEKPMTSIKSLEKVRCGSSDKMYAITLDIDRTPIGYDYWFGFLATAYDSICYPNNKKAIFCPTNIVYSTDNRISKFNQSTYPYFTCENMNLKEFGIEALITKNVLDENNSPISFLQNYFYRDRYFISVVAASEEYSNYYRSIISNLNYEYGKDENPFNSPQKIYGNIDGGLGIFSCYNRVVLKIE